MPGDSGPNGPPIAGAPGGGSNMFKTLGPTKVAIVATLAILVGALGAMIPKYLI